MATGNAILKNGVSIINNVLAATYLRQQNSVPKLKPTHIPFIPLSEIKIISFAY